MADAIIINDQELAILCDLMDGCGAKWGGNLDADKSQMLHQLIAKGFIELADQPSIARYKHTRKASVLLAELCVGTAAAKQLPPSLSVTALAVSTREPAGRGCRFLARSRDPECPLL